MGGGWDVTLERHPSDAGTDIMLGVADLPVASLAPGLTDGSGPSYPSTLAVQARLRLDGDGGFGNLDGTLSAGKRSPVGDGPRPYRGSAN